MATIEYSNGKTEVCHIEVWEDLHNERAGFFRAFWTAPGTVGGSPVIGYCSPGGSHRTISAVAREVRRLGYADPIYRNGRLVKGI